MKRKWLIGLLSVFMVLAMCFGVVACGGDTEKDEETAQTVINQLNGWYLNASKDTPDDFQRLAQVRVGDTTYPVDWSANVKTQGYDNCVKVGTEKDATGKITIDITRVTVDVEYTLTATVKVNDVTKSASYEHRIPKKSAENSNTATLDFSEPSNRTQFDAKNNLQVWSSNGITLTNTGSVGDYTKPVRLYKNTTVTIEMEGSNIIHIDFHSASAVGTSNYPDNLKTSLEASDLPIKGEISVSEDGLTFGVDFETPMESVTFKTTAGQCRLTSIDVEGVVRTHTHHWTYEHIAGTWTHTATCTAEGCDVGTRTENCTPVLNECACGYTYTAKEIVDALFALQAGKSLPGTYTLTGKVTDVTELDTNKYYNVTFKMTVEGKELTVYRAKGDQYAEIAVGGTATVNGELLDYDGTKEFTQGGTIVSFTPGVDDRTPQQKVTAALAKVNAEYTVNAAGNYTLPTPMVDGVTFSWAKKSGNYELSADGKSLVIGTELPAEAADAVLTLTASYGSETLTGNTKDVTFHIKAKSTTPTPTGDFVLDGEGLAAALGGAKGYQTGTYTVNGVSVELDTVMPNDAFYNGTSSYPYGFNVMQLKASAGTIKVTGTFTALTIVVVSGYDYSDSSLVVTAGTTQLTVKDHTEADANFAVGDQAWKAYTINYDVTGSGEQTISIKAGQYAVYVKSISLTGTAGSGSQGGGSQGGGGSETPTGTFTPLTEAKTGTFKFALYYGTDKSYYYATGAMSGYYFATSTNLSEAADFVIESVGENQYTIKVGGKYLEFAPRTGKNSKDETKNNEGVNIEMNATQTEGKYWQWVEGIQNFVMESTYNKTGDESATDLYYFGNYGTYTSMSGNFIGRIATGSDGSYTPNDTEGVSQWVAHFGTLENSSTKPETAQDKVDKALAAVEDSYTVDKAGDYMLPAAPEGLTFTWAKTSGDFTLTNGNALSIGAELPDEAKIVVLTLTVTCGDEAVTNNTKTVTIHINAKSTTPVEPQTTKVTLTTKSVFGDATSSAYNSDAVDYTVDNATVTLTNVMLGTYTTENVKVLQLKSGTGTIVIGGKFSKVTITALVTYKYDSWTKKPSVKVGSSDTALTDTMVSKDEACGTAQSGNTSYNAYRHVFSYDVTGDISYITISTNGSALYLEKIELSLAENATAHAHSYTYTNADNNATEHTASCTTCGYSRTEKHVYSDNSDDTCNSCSYQRTLDTSTWTLVKSIGTLQAGAKIVLVADTKAHHAVNGGFDGNSYLKSLDGVEAGKAENTVSLPTGAQELTLGGSEGAWTFSIEGSGTLYVTADDNAKMAATNSPSANYQWTIGIDAETGAATIKLANSSYSKNALQFNNSSPRFGNYAGTQTNPLIYVKS